MKLHEIDILLRNKLQFMETDVSESERIAVLEMVAPSKTSKKLLMFYRLSSVLSCIIIYSIVSIFSKSEQLVSDSNGETKPIFEKDHPILNKSIVISNKPSTLEQIIYGKDKIILSPKTEINSNFEILDSKLNSPDILLLAPRKSLSIYQFKSEKLPQYFASLFISEKFQPKKIKLESVNKSAPQICFWLSPTNTFEKTISSANNKNIHEDFNKVNQMSNLNSVNFGIKLLFNPLKSVGISSGLSFETAGHNYKFDFKRNKIPVIDSATSNILGYIQKADSASQTIKEKGVHRASYVTIPVSIRMNIVTGSKFNVAVESKFSLQRLISEKGGEINPTTLLYSNMKNYTKNSCEISIGLPITIHPYSNFSYLLGPFVSKSIGSLNNNINLQTKRLSYSLNFGLQFNLKK